MNDNKIKKAIMADNKKNDMEITSVKIMKRNLKFQIYFCVFIEFFLN